MQASKDRTSFESEAGAVLILMVVVTVEPVKLTQLVQLTLVAIFRL